MPYQWTRKEHRTELAVWPYRSLPRRGFVLVIAATATLLSLPLLAVLGTPILWGLLPFIALALGALWFGFSRNYRDADLLEELTITPRLIRLTRHNPSGDVQDWQSNSYWAQVEMHARGGPVPHYLTLRGDGPREVEIGRFLSEAERRTLFGELSDALRDARSHTSV
ncbi:Uncharacterized membrane protein [Poseidonocella pacifica]|uniref:Uncharacterized membrane protein n=1 Tax=Poseidonocella pacifica TaxID=871651 RepID=A0A1I0W8L2_9RHOB|nr:DUF2244 domain-containing protein [Poseidonocella pacifica]SFA85065.1 Uncharacterized membrane protein [Poseidonocella pacifica]